MYKLILVSSLVLANFLLLSQNEPFGFTLVEEKFNLIPVQELATFNQSLLLEEDTRTEKAGGRSNYGRIIQQSYDQDNCGQWTDLPNGDRLWQFRFRTANAKGVCVYFDKLFLPIGSSLFLYSSDRKSYVGPFGNEDCNDHGHFMVGEVIGDEAVLEYYEPASVVGNVNIGIYGIAHLYRYVYANDQNRGGGSEACEVEVNCPEGDAWQAERDATVRLQIVDGNLVGSCSGSMVNTVVKDCRNYLLTALHCGEGVSDADWLMASVRFKYQRAECTTGSTPSTNNKVGMFHLADSNDGGGETGSDFLLLELEDDIPSSWVPYYAGWDATGSTPDSGVSIHHPAGDRKKISTTDNVISGTYGVPGFHWRVKWIETETNWGVTEPGSSGSPLFDENHRIVGTLTGGLSFCDDPTASDYYGKFSKHWSSNPNSASQKLKVWLDPENTGVLTMEGSYVHSESEFPCDPSIVGVDPQLAFQDVVIYPTLADHQVTFETSKFRSIQEVRLFSSSGALVGSYKAYSEKTQIPTSSLAEGLYYITFIENNGSHLTKKIAIAH